MPHPRASLERSRAPLFTAGTYRDSFDDVPTEDDDTAQGGAEAIDWTEQDVVFLHRVGLRPVIVHGGGPQISAMLKRLRTSGSKASCGFAPGASVAGRPASPSSCAASSSSRLSCPCRARSRMPPSTSALAIIDA